MGGNTVVSCVVCVAIHRRDVNKVSDGINLPVETSGKAGEVAVGKGKDVL